MAAPGVSVTTAVRSGPTGFPRTVSGQYFPVGLAERGPTDVPVKINSLADYRKWFGNRVSYGMLYDDLAAYFEAGGTQAHVLRVVGAAATKGNLVLEDGSAVPTVRAEAASEGAWSTTMTVQVEVGTAGPDTRKVTVRVDGAIVEVYNNLTSVAQIVSRFAASPYVRMIDLGSVTAAPGNLPAVSAAAPLSAGTDDRAAVNAARIEAVLPRFKIGLGDGAVAAPGYGNTVHAALIAHARTHRRIALLSSTRGATAGDLAATALALATTEGAHHAGLFAGYLQVSDGAGGIRVISPEGYVAAARAKAHEQYGPWAPGAGELSVTPYVLGVDTEFSREDAEVLSNARVNPIRLVQGKFRLYDWRSLSANDTDYASLSIQDTLNRLVNECEMRLEPFVFRTIDGRGHLRAQMRGILIGVLEPIRVAGGLFERNVDGEVLDPGYSVNIGDDINTLETLARNELHAEVAVRLSPNASLITLSIVKVGLAAAV